MLVVVHGGVSARPKDKPSLSYCFPSASERPTALDAVETAVIALEDDPALNAGFGATLTLEGSIELDAGICDGPTGRCGSVANVDVRNPIVLARRVLEETPHVMLAGAGAEIFAGEMERLTATSDRQQTRWAEARAQGRLDPAHYAQPDHVDTVGAVALDDRGALAAGSSTGGVFAKMPGRVGDSAIFGAGFYASASAAVVGTGVGELFVATLASFRVGSLIESGVPPQEACETVIAYLATRADLAAGLLAIDAHGSVGAAFRGETWAVEGPDGPLKPVQRKT